MELSYSTQYDGIHATCCMCSKTVAFLTMRHAVHCLNIHHIPRKCIVFVYIYKVYTIYSNWNVMLLLDNWDHNNNIIYAELCNKLCTHC